MKHLLLTEVGEGIPSDVINYGYLCKFHNYGIFLSTMMIVLNPILSYLLGKDISTN